VKQDSIHLHFNWKVWLFSVVFLVVFVQLGIWQLRRANEKVELLRIEQERWDRAPVGIADVPQDPALADGVPVVMRGKYLNRDLFLLDNRVLDGRVGFEVLTPFRDAGSGRLVLVNRGFVRMARTRSDPPVIPPPRDNPEAVRGHVHVPADGDDSGHGMSTIPGSRLHIVEAENPGIAESVLHEPMYAYIVRLDVNDPDALPRYWPVTVMSPQRHRGYAIQWFAMALAVFGAWLFFTFRRVGGPRDEQPR
jgi:surfeit locus 1 family protein